MGLVAAVIPGAWEGFLEEVALSQASKMSRTVCGTDAGPSPSEGAQGTLGAVAGAGAGGETSMAGRLWRIMAKTQALSWAQRGLQDTFLFLPSSSRNTEWKLGSTRHVKLNQIYTKRPHCIVGESESIFLPFSLGLCPGSRRLHSVKELGLGAHQVLTIMCPYW